MSKNNGAKKLVVVYDFFEGNSGVVTGHVLAKEDDGTTATIPSSILKHSVEQMTTVNVNDSLSLLTTVDRPVTQSDYSRLTESTDHVIWYVTRYRSRHYVHGNL